MLGLHTASCLNAEILMFPVFPWMSVFPRGQWTALWRLQVILKAPYLSWGLFNELLSCRLRGLLLPLRWVALGGDSCRVSCWDVPGCLTRVGSRWQLPLQAPYAAGAASLPYRFVCVGGVFQHQQSSRFLYRMHPREGKVYSHLWCVQEFCFQMLLRSIKRTFYLQECWQEGEAEQRRSGSGCEAAAVAAGRF